MQGTLIRHITEGAVLYPGMDVMQKLPEPGSREGMSLGLQGE
jgi:hypothetical protein